MWLTVDGMRCLRGHEARLLCRAVASMLPECLAAGKGNPDSNEPYRVYGIDWFDQWEAEQKIWLLEQVTTALLTEQKLLKPAAMWEATVDAIFQHVFEALLDEMDNDFAKGCELVMEDGHAASGLGGWQQNVLLVLQQQQRRAVKVDHSVDQKKEWRRRVMQISDRILGVAAYHVIENYRDQETSKVATFLEQKGLPADFLEQIPPVLGQSEGVVSTKNIHQLLERYGHAG
jgi:hypothetical protein